MVNREWLRPRDASRGPTIHHSPFTIHASCRRGLAFQLLPVRACDNFHKLPRAPIRSVFPTLRMATETTLRPGEIKDILLKEIEAADLHELDVEEVGSVLEVKDGIARI